MTQDLDTEIEGSPSTIEGVAEWLRVTLRDGASDHADTLIAQRSRADGAWEGGAASAFRGHVTTTADAGDTLSSESAAAGRSLDLVAAALREAKREMGRARSEASGGGLTVAGLVVQHPGEGPPRPTTPSADAPQAIIDSHNLAVDAYDAHQALLLTWNDVVEIAEGALERLDEALLAAVERWQTNAGNLASLTQGFIAGGVEGLSAASKRSHFRGAANLNDLRVTEISRHLDELNPDGRPRTSAGRMYQMMDDVRAHDLAAEQARADAKNPRLTRPSSSAVRAMRVLGVATGVHGAYDDYVNGGESMGQAVTSNAGGVLAGMAAGAIIGTAIPIPVVGTVVGAIIGAGVGIVTSGMIDSMWENGVDGVGDVVDAGLDGLKELGGTVKDVGGLAKDGWNSLFG